MKNRSITVQGTDVAIATRHEQDYIPIMKQWAKREEQIERVMGATVGMYGDLHSALLEGCSWRGCVSCCAVL